ncbi:hypothetical protein B0H21DRAFT_742987 [Amylocystis lapponica]|nr:hypothetical protein B0H21DRAFT_742987 [Amylocystis lapponica]
MLPSSALLHPSGTPPGVHVPHSGNTISIQLPTDAISPCPSTVTVNGIGTSRRAPVEGPAVGAQNAPGEGVPAGSGGVDLDGDIVDFGTADEEFQDGGHPVYRYPPVYPFDANDPMWVDRMMATLRDQCKDVERDVEDAHEYSKKAVVDLALARQEMEEELEQMELFLHEISAVAGESFVRHIRRCVEQGEGAYQGERNYDVPEINEDADDVAGETL